MIVLKIKEEEMSAIIHDLIRIASILKAIENGSLTPGQKQIIHGCEIRLHEIRQDILESVEENGNKNG